MPPVHKRLHIHLDTTKGLELVIHPDVGSYQKGFRVKMVKGMLMILPRCSWMLMILPHGISSFFTSRGSRSNGTRRHTS